MTRQIFVAMNHLLRSLVLLLALFSGASGFVAAERPLTPDDLAFFENKIRPVLVEHCYECHASNSEEIGGKLLLDSRDGIQKGGESGATLIAGEPNRSLIIQAMRHDGLEMPPEEPLPESVVHDFVKWVERGAPDPRSHHLLRKKDPSLDQAVLWSLQMPEEPAQPAVQNQKWSREQLDRFVLAQIEAAGLSPTSDAHPSTLIRRMYFDLIGLPPSIGQIEQFVSSYQLDQVTAIRRLVDDLLAMPQFGERWGRHWLDVARYGESNGNDGLGRNPTFPHAWRYRDYVIAAFNCDTPYDQFLLEQIAGDLMPSDSAQQRDRQLIATGFLAMGAKPAKAMNTNFDMDVVADQIDAIGIGIMGLSVGCARCHDHKFDPVPTRDYYALAGIFSSTETMWGLAANEVLTAPRTDLHVLKAASNVMPPENFVETVLVLESNTGKPKPIPKSKWSRGTPLAMGVRDRGKPVDCKINIKGDAKKLGEVVPRGFLAAIAIDSELAIHVNSKQSGRLQLAQWLTNDRHPLTARVMVNRIWQHLFGKGIVRTVDDFGYYGARPTHPELLDHLATKFVRQGWSVKNIIRNIVLSRTYQLDSHANETVIAADATNLLLARHDRRQLDAESLRDRMLFASGELDLTPGEGSLVRHRDILVNLAGNLHQPNKHRSVYLCYLRGALPPELTAFNLPDFTTVKGQRANSTLPGQALYLYNNSFVIEQATCFARRVISHTGDGESKVKMVFRHALGRNPSPIEKAQALALLQRTKADLQSEEKAWTSFCQAMFLTNEFRFVD